MITRPGLLYLILSLIAIGLGAANLGIYFSGNATEHVPSQAEASGSQRMPPSLERTTLVSPGRDFAQSIAKAVADANAGKTDEIRFLPGEYEMPGGLVIEKKFGQRGLRISGAGAGLTRLVFHDGQTAILVRLDTDIRQSAASPAL